MNLLEHHFEDSFLLSRIPYRLESCTYEGEIKDGIQRFDIVRNQEESSWLVAPVIRKEEEILWKACHELLSRTLKEAGVSLRGFFGFDLISVELGPAMDNFQWDNLRQLVSNHAKTLNPGEEKLIQYTSLYGILKKRINEEWGKIDYHSAVKIYNDPPEKIDLLIKKLMKEGDSWERPYKVMLCDLSRDPIYKAENDEQRERLGKLFEPMRAAGEFIPEVYIFDSRNVVELGSLFGFRDRHV